MNQAESRLMEELAAEIRRGLAERRMSVSELARRVGVGRPYLHRVLAGEQVPTIEWVERVAVELGIRVVIGAK